MSTQLVTPFSLFYKQYKAALCNLIDESSSSYKQLWDDLPNENRQSYIIQSEALNRFIMENDKQYNERALFAEVGRKSKDITEKHYDTDNDSNDDSTDEFEELSARPTMSPSSDIALHKQQTRYYLESASRFLSYNKKQCKHAQAIQQSK